MRGREGAVEGWLQGQGGNQEFPRERFGVGRKMAKARGLKKTQTYIGAFLQGTADRQRRVIIGGKPSGRRNGVSLEGCRKKGGGKIITVRRPTVWKGGEGKTRQWEGT